MTHDKIEAGGRTRTFVRTGQDSSDLVLVFHGSKQNGAKHRDFTGGSYDRLPATVLYPDGYRGNWNDARRDAFYPARREQVDDVAFVRALVDRYSPQRVLAAGYSNGGQMVMRLLHEAPGLLSGAVVIGATMLAPADFLFPDAELAPTPVVLVHGTHDPIVPYAGGGMSRWKQRFFRVRGQAWSMPRTAAYFAGHNGITTGPVTTALPASEAKTSVERTEYRQDGRPPVTLWTVHGGGHTVPGPATAPRVLGRTNHDVSAADLLGGLIG